MTTLLLVHGGGHGSWRDQRVARLVRGVYTSTMTGVGERSHLRSPDVDLNLQIDDIVNVLRFEESHEVVLVGHSHGGMLVTGTADHASGRIANLVYPEPANPKAA
jgi:pimeloyl-ACP methyl ester carboxylesterase